MAQVNVAYEDRLLAHLDAVAEGRGLSRPDLLRAIAEEAVRAGEQGRAMFEPPKLPIDPGTAVTLALKVEQISIDLDRILRAAERREKRLVEAFSATDEANREAMNRLGEMLAARFAQGATPFSELLDGHLEAVEDLYKQVMSAALAPDWITGFNARLDVIEAAAKTPRTVNRYEIAPDWRMPAWQLCVGAVTALFAAAVVITTLARLTPDAWIANPMARAMYGNADQAMCELWKAKHGAKVCPVLVPLVDKPKP